MATVVDKQPTVEQSATEPEVNETVQSRIEVCAYRFFFNKVTWHYKAGCLTLRGRVPTFYLKQVLQELMRGIKQVAQIQNDVDVISATGLSSEAPAKTR